MTDDLNRWRGFVLGILIVLGVWALILLGAWGAGRVGDCLRRPAAPPAAKTALVTGSAHAKALHEWYPPARVPASYRALAARMEKP